MIRPCHTPRMSARAAMDDEDSVQPLGQKRSGLYYEGFVGNLEDTLEAHRLCTVMMDILQISSFNK